MLNNSKKEQIRGLTVWTVILIVVAIIVVGIVVLSFILSRKSQQMFGPTPMPTEETTKPAPQTPRPAAIFSCMGKIEDVKGNTIKIKANGNFNPLLDDKSFEIIIGNEAKILLLEGSFDIIEEKEGAKVVPLKSGPSWIGQAETEKEKLLNLNDLKIGDSIVVLSSEDITNKDSFMAKEIYKIK